jgi:hypothetical protein
MRGLEETTGCIKLAAERRTRGASSAGAGISLGSSGTATRAFAATAATVLHERDAPALAMLGGFVAMDVLDV